MKYKELDASPTNDFKVGDRVRVYGKGNEFVDGDVFGVGNPIIQVRHARSGQNDDYYDFWHWKACRKLEEAYQRKPRDWWIAFERREGDFFKIETNEPENIDRKIFEVVRVREVLEGDE